MINSTQIKWLDLSYKQVENIDGKGENALTLSQTTNFRHFQTKKTVETTILNLTIPLENSPNR